MKRVCVFCGSSPGEDGVFAASARQVGGLLASRGIGVVFGGGCVGLMGVLADAVLSGGGEAVGVIPRGLWNREVGHTALTAMHVVETMHQRKAMMAELSDGFVALPGGIGTLEELFEVWTWAQLGIHRKPCALLNVDGYFDPLLSFVDRAVEKGFVRSAYRAMLLVDVDPAALLARMEMYEPPTVQQWLGKEES
ncbi:MAG TPA: TIGR00730 family Rossman fold protein [Gemmatimonadaceae bacterium]|nr:TIGR00730 family Rossman fold protein [Gemmatimonadaceae bacterium]